MNAERLEISLIRELESAHSSGAEILAVEHASPYQWANACHDLWKAGRLNLLEYAVPRLRAAHPDLTYLASLEALLHSMPTSLPAPISFRDDPTAEIQIVQRPHCESVLLCFCAREGTLGLPINFVHQWLGRCPASLVYVKDFRELCGGGGYPTLGPDRTSAIAAFQRIADAVGAERVYTLGVSLGGYAALYYGLKLRAVAVLSIAGATDLSPDFVATLSPVPPEYLEMRKLVPEYLMSLREQYASASYTPRALLAYSSLHLRDCLQAEQMAGLPNVELIAVNRPQHNVIDPLIADQQFMPLLLQLLSTASPASCNEKPSRPL